jgi:hypothetical protein
VCGTLLGNDERLRGPDRQAEQLAAVLEAREENGEKRRLARFPEAGQQRQLPGGEEAVPQPGRRGRETGTEGVRFEAGERLQAKHVERRR